ncbi:MAG: hypothetical protein DRN66_00610 [Candidatus Nanohalarchaeota archaeon]|nr:MAG: hypothetical protein DRN66_00610 [Candidatus Nanohaloarchaeota archaeon]
MKIYFASQSFYPYIGGVSTYLLALEKEMVKKGNEVVEVHLRLSGEPNEDEIEGIEIHRVPREPIDREVMLGYSKFKEAVYKECHYNANAFAKDCARIEGYEEFNKVNDYFGKELEELLKHAPADIVHIHDFQLLFTYKYVPRGTPLIITWHIPFIKKMSKELSEFLIKHLNEYDKVVFSSQQYIDAAVSAGLIREKAELICPITNTHFFKATEVNKESVKEKYGIPAKSKLIMSVQRIDPKSGHEQLIRAMPKIIKEVPEAMLIFVGSKSMSNKLSSDRALLEKKIKKLIKTHGLEKNIIFTGNISDSSLLKLYNTVDLVALCSKNEGFGLSVTEAMSCGKPIVGTNAGGIPIQVKNGKNGFLVDVGDINATAKSIIKILSDETLRKKMSLKSTEFLENKFNIERGIEKHLMLYNKVKKEKNELPGIENIDASKYRAIITDFDKTITDKTAKAVFDPDDLDLNLLKEMKKLNMDLVLATGRNIRYVKKMCKKFRGWRCVVAENGAVLYFPKTKKTITINTYYMARAKKIIRNLNLPGTTVGKVIVSNRIEDKEFIIKKLGKIAEHVKFCRNENEIMVLPIKVDKGVGLRLAMMYMNIDMDKTIVIGNGENDIDIFLNPGFKIALDNSDEKLKKLANHVTKSPTTKGIIEIIKGLKS